MLLPENLTGKSPRTTECWLRKTRRRVARHKAVSSVARPSHDPPLLPHYPLFRAKLGGRSGVERPNDVTKLSYAYNNYSPARDITFFSGMVLKCVHGFPLPYLLTTA